MKILALLALLPVSSFACDNLNTQYFVSNVVPLPLPGPGGRPVPIDGTNARPFRTLKAAIDEAVRRDFCQIRIRLDAGLYDGNLAVTRSLEILGKERTATRIRGGLFSSAGQLKLWDLGVEGATIRAIRQQNGQINLNRVNVTGYHFVPSLVAARPAAVELTNSQGAVVGLDVKNGDQPALLVSGAGARVKVAGAGITSNHTSPYADQSAQPARYAGAVEIADGAIANLLVSTVKLNQYAGVLVRDKAQLLVTSSEIASTWQSAGFATNVGPDGIIVAGGSVLEAKNAMIQQNARAGLLSLNSWVAVRASTLRNSKYGFVNRDGDTDGKNGYDSFKCATLDGTNLNANETGYVPGDNLPVPNEPVPIPCPPGQTCPTPPPPQTPPLVCKSVPLL